MHDKKVSVSFYLPILYVKSHPENEITINYFQFYIYFVFSCNDLTLFRKNNLLVFSASPNPPVSFDINVYGSIQFCTNHYVSGLTPRGSLCRAASSPGARLSQLRQFTLFRPGSSAPDSAVGRRDGFAAHRSRPVRVSSRFSRCRWHTSAKAR